MKVREEKSTFKAILHYLTFGFTFKDHVIKHEIAKINEARYPFQENIVTKNVENLNNN